MKINEMISLKPFVRWECLFRLRLRLIMTLLCALSMALFSCGLMAYVYEPGTDVWEYSETKNTDSVHQVKDDKTYVVRNKVDDAIGGLSFIPGIASRYRNKNTQGWMLPYYLPINHTQTITVGMVEGDDPGGKKNDGAGKSGKLRGEVISSDSLGGQNSAFDAYEKKEDPAEPSQNTGRSTDTEIVGRTHAVPAYHHHQTGTAEPGPGTWSERDEGPDQSQISGAEGGGDTLPASSNQVEMPGSRVGSRTRTRPSTSIYWDSGRESTTDDLYAEVGNLSSDAGGEAIPDSPQWLSYRESHLSHDPDDGNTASGQQGADTSFGNIPVPTISVAEIRSVFLSEEIITDQMREEVQAAYLPSGTRYIEEGLSLLDMLNNIEEINKDHGVMSLDQVRQTLSNYFLPAGTGFLPYVSDNQPRDIAILWAAYDRIMRDAPNNPLDLNNALNLFVELVMDMCADDLRSRHPSLSGRSRISEEGVAEQSAVEVSQIQSLHAYFNDMAISILHLDFRSDFLSRLLRQLNFALPDNEFDLSQ